MDESLEILIRLQGLSYEITNMQQKFDSGELKGANAASTLQKLKRQRKELQGKIKPYLAFSHPFPEILPPALKRTPEEVRRIIGIANDA